MIKDNRLIDRTSLCLRALGKHVMARNGHSGRQCTIAWCLSCHMHHQMSFYTPRPRRFFIPFLFFCTAAMPPCARLLWDSRALSLSLFCHRAKLFSITTKVHCKMCDKSICSFWLKFSPTNTHLSSYQKIFYSSSSSVIRLSCLSRFVAAVDVSTFLRSWVSVSMENAEAIFHKFKLLQFKCKISSHHSCANENDAWS